MNPDLESTSWPKSLWLDTAIAFDPQPALKGPVECEVGIIGAGYTGLSAALHLAEFGVSSAVIDRNQPGWGCSGRNGGQVNPNWKALPSDMERHYSHNDLAGVIRMANRTCDLVFDLIKKYRIDCNAIRPGYVHGVIGYRGRSHIDNWMRQWQTAGSDAEALDRQRIADLVGSDHYDCGMLDHRGGSLQPLSYTRGLARVCMQQGVRIYGDTEAVRIARDGLGWKIQTPGGTLGCRTVVLGTNGYTGKTWRGLNKNIVPVASLISATEPLPEDIAEEILPGRQAVSESGGVPHYYRMDENNRLLFGGRGSVFGRTGNLDTEMLRRAAIRIFPVLSDTRWEYDWGGYVAMTTHHRPLLLRLEDNVYSGLGYNGRGLAMATMMGKQLAMAACEGRAQMLIERSKPISLHRFYSLGIATRIISGQIGDAFTRRIQG